MTEIIFYGGVDEIGGNKVLVSDGDSKIFLDFGMSFKGGACIMRSISTQGLPTGLETFWKWGLSRTFLESIGTTS